MSASELQALTVAELAPRLRRREVAAREVVGAALAAIEAAQPRLNAFTVVDAERALAEATAADEAIARGGWLGPLHGVPVAVKDNYLTTGLATTACSKVLAENVPASDATVVGRLRRAGAIVVGKTNMHEWAYGATNEVSHFGPVCNPWNTAHIPGGSSGGSGAALAARLVPAALGSDTGGSVRIPASACGVSGLKPTFGRLSRHGVLPLSWSLDVPGPMARSAADLALMLGVMAGRDALDSTTVDRPVGPFVRRPERILRGLRIAVLTGDNVAVDPEVGACSEAALATLAEHGAVLCAARLPGIEAAFAAWKAIMMSEATAYHEPYLATRSGDYAAGVRVQLETGRFITAPQYLKAQQFRVAFGRDVAALLADADVVALSTLPVAATRIGQQTVSLGGREITPQDAMTYVTWIANMSGLPAVSTPCGFAGNGLPVGLTFMGPAFAEMRLLALADAFEALTDWHRRAPAT